MKKYTLILMAAMFAFSNIEACVTYNPNDGTYTVDPDGSVDN